MQLINQILARLLPWLLIAVAAVAGWFAGERHGQITARLTQAQNDAEQSRATLSQFVDSARLLTASASQASEALSQQIAARQRADDESTGAINEVLKKTAAARVHCVFTTDVMQQLNAARERAAAAATAGITGPPGDTVRPATRPGK